MRRGPWIGIPPSNQTRSQRVTISDACPGGLERSLDERDRLDDRKTHAEAGSITPRGMADAPLSSMRSTRTLLIASLLVAVVAGACGDDAMMSGDIADAAIARGNERGDMFADAASEELFTAPTITDEMALAAGMMRAIDVGEIAQAHFALERTTDPRVVDYAHRMIAVHAMHVAELEAVGVTYGFTTKSGETSEALVEEAGVMMRDLAMTDDPEHVYIQQQVSMHEAARLVLDQLIRHFPDAGFQDFIQASRDMVVDHKKEAVQLLRGS